MNSLLVDRLADAILYEGYVLYPYRPSVKNRQRWTFGGLVPRAYSEAQEGSDNWTLRTECLLQGNARTTLQIWVRFLHLLARQVWKLDTAQSDFDEAAEPACHLVESLQVGDRMLYTWQEASERAFAPESWSLETLVAQPWRGEFVFPSSRQREPVRDLNGEVVGLVVREQEAVAGRVEVSAEEVTPGVFEVRVTLENSMPLHDAGERSRDEALMKSLLSSHVILSVREGEFLSLLDPPEELRDLARDCHNVGVWPVLVGNPGEQETMLASPIILYDYPRIADESPGDLFDSTEIDEILTLRIQALTDDEKRQASAIDDRVRALLERTASLARDQVYSLHGTMHGRRELPNGEP